MNRIPGCDSSVLRPSTQLKALTKKRLFLDIAPSPKSERLEQAGLQCVFTHVASVYANLLAQTKAKAYEKSSASTEVVWHINMAAISLFRNTSMDAVTSCKIFSSNRLVQDRVENRLAYVIQYNNLVITCYKSIRVRKKLTSRRIYFQVSSSSSSTLMNMPR